MDQEWHADCRAAILSREFCHVGRRRRIEQGNLSNVKGVGAGVLEYRIDVGPGYRVYFGRDGGHLVILLAGGTKRRQQQDIAAAQARWHDYKRRRKTEK